MTAPSPVGMGMTDDAPVEVVDSEEVEVIDSRESEQEVDSVGEGERDGERAAKIRGRLNEEVWARADRVGISTTSWYGLFAKRGIVDCLAYECTSNICDEDLIMNQQKTYPSCLVGTDVEKG